jgi:5-methylcytosine-specific restriction endonuclease McrA
MLLRDEKAHVVRLHPFTIQLDYESTTYRQEVSLGIDAGSVHIGVSATTEKKELFAAEVVLRTDIVKKLASRLEMRRTRRNRKTRYRKPRFNNRRRKEGWLAPSVRNKVESHLKVIRLVHRILPVTKTTIEVAQFDAQKIKNDAIQGVEYQQGEQMCFWNIREYVLARDGHKCQHCKGKSGDKILNVHHLESRKTGGNAPNNLITLCETCHKAYHRGEFELNVNRGTSLRDVAAMNIMRWAVYNQAKAEFENVHLTYGFFTKHVRICNGITKSHTADARCISGNPLAAAQESIYVLRLRRRHNRQIHKCTILKGGYRKLNQAPYTVKGYRLFDKVRYQGQEAFIYGRRTSGSFSVKTFDGRSLSDGVSFKKLLFQNISRTCLITKKRNVPFPPLAEPRSIHGVKS